MKMKVFKLKQWIENVDMRSLLKIFPFLFMFHELEEWNILSWHRQLQTNVPPDVTNLEIRTFFVFVILLFFVLTYIILIPKNKKINSYLMLPFFSFVFYNGIVHLFWSFYFKTYAPGVIFGFFIGAPFIILVVYKMLKENLVKKWYVLIFVILSIFLVTKAVNYGIKLEPGVANAMLFGKKLANFLWY